MNIQQNTNSEIIWDITYFPTVNNQYLNLEEYDEFRLIVADNNDNIVGDFSSVDNPTLFVISGDSIATKINDTMTQNIGKFYAQLYGFYQSIAFSPPVKVFYVDKSFGNLG